MNAHPANFCFKKYVFPHIAEIMIDSTILSVLPCSAPR